MLGYLRGVIRHKVSSYALVDVGGAGFEVYMNPNTLSSLPEVGSTVELYTHLHVREDGYALYGFNALQERDIFRVLISIPKIGPKLALAILSEFNIPELVMCVELGDSSALVRVSGIGIKTANRLMMDLREKFRRLDIDIGDVKTDTAPDGDILRDAIDALVVMGFSQKESRRAVLAIQSQADSAETAVRLALASLSTFAI